MKKLSKRGAWPRSDDLFFFKFRHPLIFLEWLKIQTSNFARGLEVRDLILNKNAKLLKTGCGLDHCNIYHRSRDILNIQATEALRNIKIQESIAFDFQQGYQMWIWLGYFSDQKKQQEAQLSQRDRAAPCLNFG